MDLLAHALWTNLAYFDKYRNNLKQRLWAVFFGLMPDLVSFTLAFLFSLSRFGGQSYLADLTNSNSWVFVWARESYKYTHSLVIFAIALVLVLALRKGKMYWPIWGWALHIAIDIFTHKEFYATPFLFPISNFKNQFAIQWSEPHFMFINYGALAMVYIFLFYFARKKSN